MRYLLTLLFSATLLLIPHGLYAQTQVELSASKDNTLYESATGAFSNGVGDFFFVGRTNQPSESIRRALFAFDVAGQVPAGATIESVQLKLNMSKAISGAEAISLHRALADWGEGTSDAPGNEGAGAPSANGDATWRHTSFNTTTWATPGGDFTAEASATLSVNAIGFYTWGTTDAMVADVQQWLDNPTTNFGWLLKGTEAVSATSKRFDSRENPNTANRPVLMVTYSLANRAPGLPVITAPAGTSIAVEGDPATPFVATWDAAPDPDGDTVTYTWQLSVTDDFSQSARLLSTDVGTATRFETTFGAIAALLTAQGLNTGDDITLFHRAVASDGALSSEGASAQVTLTRGLVTALDDPQPLPHHLILQGNYPNPFNPTTTLRFDLPEAAQVVLEIVNLQGRTVKALPARPFAAGTGLEIRLEATDLPSGTYLYRLTARSANHTRTAVGSMTFLK